jgi:hypothetical protein
LDFALEHRMAATRPQQPPARAAGGAGGARRSHPAAAVVVAAQRHGSGGSERPGGVDASSGGCALLLPVSWHGVGPALAQGGAFLTRRQTPIPEQACSQGLASHCAGMQLPAPSFDPDSTFPRQALQRHPLASALSSGCSRLRHICLSSFTCCFLLPALYALYESSQRALSTQLLPFAQLALLFCAIAVCAFVALAAPHFPGCTALLGFYSARHALATMHSLYASAWLLSPSFLAIPRHGSRKSAGIARAGARGPGRATFFSLVILLACLRSSGASAPEVYELQPTLGPSAGGTMLTVTGNNLVGQDVFCKFGADSLVAPITLSATQIVCDTPSNDASRVLVEVTTDGGLTYSQDRMTYLFSESEVVTGISPTKGPDFGSTVVRVSGRGFQNVASLKCMFGVTAIAAKWLSSEAVECVSPPKNAGLEVSVRVANNGVDFSTSYGVFLVTGALQKKVDVGCQLCAFLHSCCVCLSVFIMNARY